jgi:hypothetical protein
MRANDTGGSPVGSAALVAALVVASLGLWVLSRIDSGDASDSGSRGIRGNGSHRGSPASAVAFDSDAGAQVPSRLVSESAPQHAPAVAPLTLLLRIVRLADGTPLAGVHVESFETDDGPAIRLGQTDLEGTLALPSIGAGAPILHLRLWWKRPWWDSGRSVEKVVQIDQPASAGILSESLDTGTTVRIRSSFQDGSAAARAHVRLAGASRRSGTGSPDGWMTFQDIDPSLGRVTVRSQAQTRTDRCAGSCVIEIPSDPIVITRELVLDPVQPR